MFPYEAGINAVKERLEENGLAPVLFNLPPGDQTGEWGTLSNPMRRDYFRSSFEMALQAAQDLNCPRLHLMFGNQVDWTLPEAQIECALENMSWAAPQATEAGITLTVEPLNPSDFPNAFLHTTQQAVDLLLQLNNPQVRLQYDVYHAQMTEGNLIHTLISCLPWIAHVQIADVPGRHQPSTGEINFPNVFSALEQENYGGYIGLEYRPQGATQDSLSWLPRSDRAC
jgi:hydroxypyruvate isomerase